MKLAALLNNRFTEVEARKKIVKSKNADEAYKKNANYFTTTANPAMEELIDLLTGKKEKKENDDLDQFIRKLKHERTVTEAASNSTQESGTIEENTVSPVEMSVNEEVSTHLLPETTMPEQQPVQLKDAGQMAKERLTEKAIATYKFQMAMAKNGFEILQPMIYRTA